MTPPDCRAILPLLAAAIDDELAPSERARLDDHLSQCPDCRAALSAQRAISRELRDILPRHAAPDELRQKLMARIKAESPPRRPVWSWAAWTGSGLALAASLALLILTPSSQDVVIDDLLTAHIRSLMPNHLIDIASSDQHSVKPWFNGRIDLSPPVPDLADAGFPLLGGRLDYIERHAGAVLIYGSRQHVINLFIWPEPGVDRSAGRVQRQGYSVLSWRRSGLAFAAVSDLNPIELTGFAGLWQKRAGG